MSSVEYSTEAVNVLNKFHRCEKLIYVEGDDDVLFWGALFNYFGLKNIKIEKKDGSSELDKFTERLITENLNIVIARDSDYKVLTGKNHKHERLITTYGYSIENTLYVPDSIIEISKLWIKDSKFDRSEFDKWIHNFTEKLEPLIYFDIANDCYDLYIDVLGDNCTKYMKTQSCDNLDISKIETHKRRIEDNFTDQQINDITNLVSNSKRDIPEIIRGHFLQSAILKFISSHLKKREISDKISNSALYTNAIQQLKISFNREHKHYEFYRLAIKPIAA